MTTIAPPGRVSPVTNALAKDRLGVWLIVGHAIAGAAPLTVLAVGTSNGFSITGTNSLPLAVLAATATLALFSVGFVAMSRNIVNAGAFYTYISRGVGKPFGVGAAFMANLSYNAMQTGLYGGFGAMMAGVSPELLGLHWAWWAWALIGWAAITLCGVLRIDFNGAILGLVLACEIVIIAVYDLAMAANPGPEGYSAAAFSLSHLSGIPFWAAVVTAITGFVGFEATTSFSEEAKDPRRTIPRATYLSLALIGGIYVVTGWLMTVATGPSHIVSVAGQQQTNLLFHLASPNVAAFFIHAGQALVVTSLLGALLAFHNTCSRYGFAQGREGVLPRVLGRAGRRSGAPVAASLTQSAIGLAVIIVFAVMGWDPVVHLFFWLTVYGGLGVLLLMAFTSIAVFLFFMRARLARDKSGPQANMWQSAVAPVLAFFALGFIISLILAEYHTLLGVPAGHIAATLFPAGMWAVFLLGMLWSGWLKLARPRVYASIGLGVSTSTITSVGGSSNG